MNKLSKHIIESARKRRIKPHTLFETFIEMSYQLNTTWTFSREFIKYEKEHYEFRMLMEELVKQYPFQDIFGFTLSDVIAFDKKNLGQCMTPYDISQLIAKITHRCSKSSKLPSEYNVNDCCAGTGSLILCQFENFINNNSTHLHININDINELMVKSALIQIQYNDTLNNTNPDKSISITAYNGNAILEFEIPENIVYHNDHSLIADPYVKGYFDVTDLKEQMNVFDQLFDMFEETEPA